MISRKVDMLAPVCGRKTVLNPALILADGDELLGPGRSDRLFHGANPAGKDFLREQIEVVNFQGVAADVSSAQRKLDFFRKRYRSLHGADGKVPGGSQCGPVGVTPSQPLVPCCQLHWVSIRPHRPQVLRDAGLINEVPCEEGNIVKASDYR